MGLIKELFNLKIGSAFFLLGGFQMIQQNMMLAHNVNLHLNHLHNACWQLHLMHQNEWFEPTKQIISMY